MEQENNESKMDQENNIDKIPKDVFTNEHIDKLFSYNGSDESVVSKIAQIRHFFLFLLQQWSLMQKQVKGQELLLKKYLSKDEENKRLKNMNYHLEISVRDLQDKIEHMVKQPKQPVHIFLEKSVMRVLEEFITENKTLKDITSNGTGYENGPQLLQEMKNSQDLIKKLESSILLKDEEIEKLRDLLLCLDASNSIQSDNCQNESNSTLDHTSFSSKREIRNLREKLKNEFEHNSSLKLQCMNQASMLAKQQSLTEYFHGFLMELVGSFRKDFDKLYRESATDFQVFMGNENKSSGQSVSEIDTSRSCSNSLPVKSFSQKNSQSFLRHSLSPTIDETKSFDLMELQKSLKDVDNAKAGFKSMQGGLLNKNLKKDVKVDLLYNSHEPKQNINQELNQFSTSERELESVINLKKDLEMKTAEQMKLIKSLNETSQLVSELKKELDVVKREYGESEAEVASWKTAVQSYKADCEEFQRREEEKEKQIQKLNIDLGNLQVKFDNYREKCTCRNPTYVADGGLFGRGIAPASSTPSSQSSKEPSQGEFTSSQLVGSVPNVQLNAIYTRHKPQQLPPEPWQNSSPWQRTAPMFQGSIAVRDSSQSTRPRPQNFMNRANEETSILQQGAVGGLNTQMEPDFWDTHTETLLTCEYCHNHFPSSILMDHIRECMKDNQ